MDEMLEDIQIEIREDPPRVEVEAFFKLQKRRCMSTQKWPSLLSSPDLWPLSLSISSPIIATTTS
jgi:hypothetical protein